LERIGLTEYGRDEIIVLVATSAIAVVGLWIAVGPWTVPAPLALLAVGLQFFRDPVRKPPPDPAEWTSPADGTVTEVAETTEARFIGGAARRVGIFMSPFNVHVNRSPADGIVKYLSYEPGKFLDARRADSSEKNESQWIGLLAEPGGIPIMVRQISGVLARRIVCRLDEGGRVTRGGKFGMVKFGSRVELYVPADAPVDIMVRPGQKVRAGETVVARVRTEAGHPSVAAADETDRRGN
jgi:phosphatidylserine decarboxylase